MRLSVAASKVAHCSTHNHQDQARNCFGAEGVSDDHTHESLGRQDDRSFGSFSLPADVGLKRNSASLDTADTEDEEELPVKIHNLHFTSGKCALRLPPWREPSPHTRLQTRKTPADSS